MTKTAKPKKATAARATTARKSEPAPAPAPRVVVSRNYSKKTECRYIVRPLDDASTEIAQLVLENATVEFTSRDSRFRVELDFGCGLVIVGDKVTLRAVPKEAVEIYHDGMEFVRKTDSKVVRLAESIFFTPDGIFAIKPQS